MNACKTMVAGVFLALAFFIGAGEAQAQYRPTGGNNGFNQAYQSPFAKTPPPNYVWRKYLAEADPPPPVVQPGPDLSEIGFRLLGNEEAGGHGDRLQLIDHRLALSHDDLQLARPSPLPSRRRTKAIH